MNSKSQTHFVEAGPSRPASARILSHPNFAGACIKNVRLPSSPGKNIVQLRGIVTKSMAHEDARHQAREKILQHIDVSRLQYGQGSWQANAAWSELNLFDSALGHADVEFDPGVWEYTVRLTRESQRKLYQKQAPISTAPGVF